MHFPIARRIFAVRVSSYRLNKNPLALIYGWRVCFCSQAPFSLPPAHLQAIVGMLVLLQESELL